MPNNLGQRGPLGRKIGSLSTSTALLQGSLTNVLANHRTPYTPREAGQVLGQLSCKMRSTAVRRRMLRRPAKERRSQKTQSTLWIAPGSVEPRLSESLPTPRSSRCFATACSLRKNAHDLLLCLAGVRAPSAGPSTGAADAMPMRRDRLRRRSRSCVRGVLRLSLAGPKRRQSAAWG